MGEEVRNESKPVSGETGNQTTGRKRKSGSDTRTDTPETGRTAGASDTGATGTPEVKDKDVLGLVEVASPVPVPEKAPAKKRTVKRKKKTTKQEGFSSTQIQTLIMAMSGILASRPDFAIFALSETEAKQLAEPIANIITNTGYSEQVGKYADHIALVTACLMIFAPRLIVFSQQQKVKKIEKNGGLKLEPVKEGKNKNSSGTTNSGASNRSTDNVRNDDTGVLASIPSLA